MDLLEKEIFGFVAPKPMTDKELDRYLEKMKKEKQQENNNEGK
jgi:hypothetical protein